MESDVSPTTLLPLQRQGALFCDYPEQPALVERVKEFLHTGKIAQKYPHAEEILKAVLNRVPYRAICKTYSVGFETVKQLYALAEASGKLRTLQKHMADEWAEVHGLTMWRLRERLLDNTMPAQSLPILAGIATQNIQLLTGLPTEIVQTKEAPELSADNINALLDRLPKARGAIIDVKSKTDSQSGDNSPKHQ